MPNYTGSDGFLQSVCGKKWSGSVVADQQDISVWYEKSSTANIFNV